MTAADAAHSGVSRPGPEEAAAELGPALLFCPADRPERFAKAADRADSVILDLEDAIGPDARPAAREHVVRWLAEADDARVAATVVRVNPVGTDDLDADLAALSGSGVRWVMLAKTESPDDVARVAEALPGAAVVALCETAAGVVAAGPIAAHPATAAVMWGAEDLVASVGGTGSRHADGTYRDVARAARAHVLLHAGAHGVLTVDSIYAAIDDAAGLSAEAEDAVASGWGAKACIHPSQAPLIRDAYRPDEDALDYARALLEEAERTPGVFRFRGSMVDGPLIAHARRTVQRAGG